MSDEFLTIRLDVGLRDDADAAELDNETVQLRDELLQLDVDGVERPAGGPVPEGARAAEVAVLGTLLVELGRGVIGGVVRTIEAWVARRRTRSVTLTLDGDCIELSNASDTDQRQLLEAFLARHATS